MMYRASWSESGTNEERTASAATKQELEALVWGNTYPPKAHTIFMWEETYDCEDT